MVTLQNIQHLIHQLTEQSLLLTTAESCTGGMISSAITDIPGSSKVFDRGFITYSNEAKHQQLGVSMSLIERYGAVSSQVAQAMAEGALSHSRADISVAVTGIAGPNGGTTEKPVGTVYIASKRRNGHCYVERHLFGGDRHAIRLLAVEQAFVLIQRHFSD